MSWNLPYMTSVRGLGPLPRLVEEELGQEGLWRLCEGTGLPPDAAGIAGLMIPLRDMVELFDRAARLTGDDLIGLRVGRQMPEGFGQWTRCVRTAPTLGESLRRIVRGLALHQSGGALRLSFEGDTASLSYRVPVADPLRRSQHVEHTLPALLDTFGLYLGAGWRPLRIAMDYPRQPHLVALEEALEVPVTADAEAPALIFPAEALEAQRIVPARKPVLNWDEMRALFRAAPPRSLSGTIRHLAEARLSTGACDLASLANQLAMSPRTLQRRLSAEGQSFGPLRDGVRDAHARRLLADREVSVTEIAYRLGYSDTAHFSRAFKRRNGLAPSVFRARGAGLNRT